MPNNWLEGWSSIIETQNQAGMQRKAFDYLLNGQEQNDAQTRKDQKLKREQLQRNERRNNLSEWDNNMTFAEKAEYVNSGKLPERYNAEPAAPASAPAPAFDMTAFATIIGEAVKAAVDEALA